MKKRDFLKGMVGAPFAAKAAIIGSTGGLAAIAADDPPSLGGDLDWRPTAVGDLAWCEDSNRLVFFDGDDWQEVRLSSDPAHD